ncbi:hypothetical protein KP509_11G048200 [Ceratopteris richardii]|uniref:HMA domain-containing protein n=1 Tax=Ceratopteris richardii TaxID=49495 RepID=A0A8T2TS89_CERRI|nr:hypothetical protein KP509_11G048200 [Ceratopteris richardii]
MSEEKKKDEGQIVLETKITCDKCRYKILKATVSYPGVEDVSIDLKGNKLILKAPNVDPNKLFEFIKKKSGGKVTKLLYPTPNEKKEPIEVTVVLKMNIDCLSCEKKIIKAAWKIKDVCSVRIENQTVVIKGWNLDQNKVRSDVSKYAGKHADIAPAKEANDKKKKENNAATQQEKEPAELYPNTLLVYHPQYFSDENPNACIVM